MSLWNGPEMRRSLLAFSTQEALWQDPHETSRPVRFGDRLADRVLAAKGGMMLKRLWDACGMAQTPQEYDRASLYHGQGQIDGSAYLEYMRREQSFVDRAGKLAEGFSPYYNIAPLVDLVRKADAMGFDVVRRPVQPADSATGD
jgi:hypothetical protein